MTRRGVQDMSENRMHTGAVGVDRQSVADALDRLWPVLYRGSVLLGCVFLLAPITVVLIISLSASPSIVFPPPSYSLAPYTSIQPEIVDAFLRSLQLSTLVVIVDLLLCVPAAFALTRARLPGRAAFETLFRSPLQVPGIVMAVVFYLYYSIVLRNTGIPLRNGLPGLVIAHVIMTCPFVLTTISLGLQGMDRRLEEASYGLGAGFFGTTWHVTFPQIRPALLSGSFLAFVISFEDVPVALFLAPGASATTLPVQLFNLALDSLSPRLFAAAILVFLFAVALVLLVELTVGLKRVMGGV